MLESSTNRRGYTQTQAIWWSVLLAMVLLTGCRKTPAPDSFPKTAPDPGQLAESRLGQFAARLKAMPASQRDAAAQQFIKENPATPLIEGGKLVEFYWYGKARSVGINGDLQHAWTKPDALEMIPCGENSFFVGFYQAPADARLDYLLNVDGKDTTDPRNPRVTPSGFGPHSEIAMPQFKPNPSRLFRESIAHGTLDSIMFTNRSASMKPRVIKVYEPAGYDALANLPSLYVYDGLEALDYMEYTNVLDNMIAEKNIQPALVVFIQMLPEDMQLFPDKFPGLASVVCDELVPLIDSAYKTARVPGSRAVTGISAFGNLALTTAFERPDVFLMAAGQSTTITEQLVATLERLSVKPQAVPLLRIYLDVGNYDLIGGAMRNCTFLKANEVYLTEMQRRGICPRYQVFNDGHQWANWRERTDTILQYFFSQRKE
jgi:enterochelin esterase-like enzyme